MAESSNVSSQESFANYRNSDRGDQEQQQQLQQRQFQQHQQNVNDRDRPTEIPAAKVRSSLVELELQASQAMQRLESIKINNAPLHEGPSPDATNPQQQQFMATSSHVLSSERRAPSEVLTHLESVILSNASDPDADGGVEGGDAEYLLPALNEVSHLALISHSIVAYLSHLDYRKLAKITAIICGDTNRWLAHLFRFANANASYHTDSADAILRAVRLAIVTRCPGYLEGGVPALANPCLYICENSSPLGLQYACRQLGLPLNCIRLVPAHTDFASFGTIDTSALQKLIKNDVLSNRTPLFVIGDVGSTISGQVDNIIELQEICRSNSMWLHYRGHSLAALAITQGAKVPIDGLDQPIADSMSLNLGSWLALPNLPVVLLHRKIENLALNLFESDPVISRRLSSLSLWTSLQAYGRDSIAGRLTVAFECCRVFHDIVSRCEGIRVLSKAAGADKSFNIADLVYKPLNVPLLFETAIPVVLFQFDNSFQDLPLAIHGTPLQDQRNSTDSIKNATEKEEAESGESQSATSGAPALPILSDQSTIKKSIEKVANFSYFDKLNSWLGQNLQRDCPEVPVEIRDHVTFGTCIRFCPLEQGLADTVPTLEQLETFDECLESQIDILRATVKHKATLHRLVEQSNVLRLVHLADWAGLGGVRFVPEGWETWLTDQAKTELNKLNTDLVDALRATDNAFSMGEGPDGLICVRFGMVTEDTDVEELLELVISVGRSVQENSRVLDTMSEIVKKGIEAATADLQRESDEKLWADGIMRHVPVLGSVVNWWSPPAKESGIKGRSLNLTQGVVESTENIYKYHMQLSTGKQQIQGTTKSTPQPMVQTSVSAGHSRQSSTTSTATNCEQTPISISSIGVPQNGHQN